MGGPENSWLVYGWTVSRKLVVKYLSENKNNNWKIKNKKSDNEWFFPENKNENVKKSDKESVEINTDNYKFYIIDDYNDYYQPDEMNVFISLIPKQVKYDIDELYNLDKDFIKHGQKIATELGSKEIKPMLISAIDVHN